MIQGTRCLINEVGSGRIFVYAYGLFVTVIADSESYVSAGCLYTRSIASVETVVLVASLHATAFIILQR